jgi:hypothetical protein
LPLNTYFRLLRAIVGLLSALIALWLLVANVRLYTPTLPPPGRVPPDVIAQLHYLKGELEQGAAADMQRLFPEGYFFSYVLYGLTWVNVGLQSEDDSAEQQQALTEARWAYAAIDSEAGRSVFSPSLDPPYGMFYVGWSNYLLAGILLLQEPEQQDTAELIAFERNSQQIAQAIENSTTPFVPSYPMQAWPVDTFPAVVSLRAHTQLVDGRYEPLIADWLGQVNSLLDEETSLTPHRTDYLTGEMLDGARGTSQVLILRFLAELDPADAQTKYQRFRRDYIALRLGIPTVQEYPPGRSGYGDIDSGPLITGASMSATAVGLGTARVMGDEEVAMAMAHAGEALGFPLHIGREKRYAFGLLPIGDLFVVWSRSSVPWLEPLPAATYAPLVPWWWRLPFHAISLLLALVLRGLNILFRKIVIMPKSQVANIGAT